MNRIATLLGSMAFAFASAAFAALDKETVAVIGTRDMGDSLGPRLAASGYRGVYGSRDPSNEKVVALVARTGHGATATYQCPSNRARTDIR